MEEAWLNTKQDQIQELKKELAGVKTRKEKQNDEVHRMFSW